MPARRIIPCLDVKDGRVVKGVQFRDHRDVGDIVENATRYSAEGADELVFYDITASPEGRSVDTAWIERVSRVIDIPFAVAGGIRDLATAEAVLEAGADKVSVNSPALARPELIDELAAAFGAQCVVIGVDSMREEGGYRVWRNTGDPERSDEAGRLTLDWLREATRRGAGEVVLNCMRKDGVRDGYDCEHLHEVVAAVTVPVIASGGAGAPRHFREAFEHGASGALAATVFHDRLIAIPDLKQDLLANGIEVRP
ncbi:MAG: imidazole glycerol phosphate synthase subunit HisF [Sphingomonadales bacterium CG12_big_fil_rev_8_21_14_0_65_65_10]|uniref:imidazole glycerol phosphate synthase subunit HisF n=1 Tax=Blastomonas marina TaxID=1867408 RepID=UPI000CA891DC|nr:imidazole glycerol phosphate synthase subunit HisF [Blastomonas marina]PIW56542.1 MAG: imidazole glycerol phosphate synthase subunit HisF [Sphingomonadales bacterium CG12_big_fil_rev_8_21_14_0_65_65_10]WPZ03143.1 imidazole glycerol phosphate synthase subunit HisF [Blastomonas marina]